MHQILAADIDQALICHQSPNIEIAFEQILKEMADSEDIKDRGFKSVERIMAYKEKYLSL
jgi:beta-N-acetylhexosaminidase